VQERVRGAGLDRQCRELPRVDLLGNRDQPAGGDDGLLGPGPVHEVRQDRDASADEALVDAGADAHDAPDAFGAHRARDGRVDGEPARCEEEVRAVDWRRLDGDKGVAFAYGRGGVVKDDDPVEVLADLGQGEMAHAWPPSWVARPSCARRPPGRARVLTG
jgi:hypothetical protein